MVATLLAYILISYTSSDRDRASWIAKELEAIRAAHS
jgi:hypothetical protein